MIIIFGAPGAGKTVQGQMLARKYGWEWISSRDLMISLRDKDVSLALNYGMPVDNEKSIQALERALVRFNFNSNRIAVLDGFPTNVSQIFWMIEHDYLKYIRGVIVLRVPRGEIWKRLLARGRVDDTRAALERRQNIYDRTIHGMLHTLKTNNIRISEIDGNNAPEDVLERIEERLGEWEIIPKKGYPKLG